MSGDLTRRLLAMAQLAVDEAMEFDYGDPEDRYIWRELQELKLLAEAQPVGPTDEELKLLVAEYRHLSAVKFARAVLSRWGRPAPVPVSVAGDPTHPAQLAADIRTAVDSTWIHQPVVAALLELASIMERQRILSADVRAIATELSRYP
jgi:hypothetical protein